MPLEHFDDLPAIWDKINAEAGSGSASKPTNHAAWQKEKCAPLIVDEAPLPVPSSGQVLVKVGVIAMNPADWAVRDMGILVPKWPCITGCDAAGTIVQVGAGIKQFQKGDRVFGFSLYLQLGDAHGAFQEYMLMDWPIIGKTPDNISDAEAATISLGTATAADGLFRGLALDLPQATPAASKNETVVVWGGSTSVGACGIQMLAAAGYNVVATSSPRNFDFCKSIGATHVVDYNSATIVEELVHALQGKQVSGAFAAMATELSITALCQTLAQVPGAVKHVSSVFPGTEKFAVENVVITFAESNVVTCHEMGSYLWGRFLPEALEKGTMKARPEPKVVGHGLNAINPALDILKAGVSATKIVVTL